MNLFLTLKEIEIEVNNLARLIKASKNELPTYGYSRDFAYPHIEVNHEGYHYVIVERGVEQKRKTTKNIHELLFWIFETITFSMAIKYELKNRIENQDFRRILWKKQIDLLSILNQKWSDEVKKEKQNIFTEHPFDDLAGLRATYCRELREAGYSENEIDKKANEKYPVNE